jgi:hypothetical protein
MAVKKTTPFVSGHALWYPYAAVKIMYDQLGVKSQTGFGKYFGKPDGLLNEDIEKILFAGLYYDPTANGLKEMGVKLEDITEKIIPAFYDLGNGYEDLIGVMMQALGDAKIADARPYFQTQKRLELMYNDRIPGLIAKKDLTGAEKDEVITIIRRMYLGLPSGSLPAMETEDTGEAEQGNGN